MFCKVRTLVTVLLITSTKLWAQGLDAVPILKDVSVSATVEISQGITPREYTYQYIVENPESNSGKIWNVKLDVSTFRSRLPANFFPQVKTSTLYDGSTIDMVSAAERLSPFTGKLGSMVVPISITTPPGWSGGYNRDGTAGISVADSSGLVQPGGQLNGIAIASRHPPALRDMESISSWFYVSDDGDEIAPDVEQQIAIAVKQSRETQRTLGPSPVPEVGSASHLDLFVRDVVELVELGWIISPTLSTQIEQTVLAARDHYFAGDPTQTKDTLSTLIEPVDEASNVDMRTEAKQLLSINIIELLNNIPDTAIPIEPVYEFTPEYSEASLAKPYTLTITVKNAAQDFAPIENFSLSVLCSFVRADGSPGGCSQLGLSPSIGLFNTFFTDSNGQFTIVASTPSEGKATFNIGTFGGEVEVGQATVKWSGGADLVVSSFVPPVLSTFPNAEVFFTDITRNIGSHLAGTTTTRYYLSATSPVDPMQATIIAERTVNPLGENEESESVQLPVTIPTDIAAGEYYLLACADAENTETETSEENNCSDSQLDNHLVQVLPVRRTERRPIVNLSDGQVIEGNSGTRLITLTAELEYSDVLEDISVSWETLDGSAIENEDYIGVSGSLLFKAGTMELSKNINIAVIGDDDVELDEVFSVVLNNPGEFVVLGKNFGVATIINDDEDAITIGCGNAYANPSTLWPPNHKFKKISVLGIEDYSDTSVNINIVSIFQDEPLNLTGDGTTKPDGKGIGDAYAELRSERSGNNDGRVYEITFTATNSVGGSCEGVVYVGVPHDKQDTPIDSGIRFDSIGSSGPD